jgi:signal transduction histidine kinase
MVAISERRLVQVLVNLVLNAADATSERGVGTVTIAIAALAPGRVAIRITDDGPGIPPEIERRIFDPFFSTKDPGQGTGLGLPICYGIVTSAGGDLVLAKTGPEGTTFELQLPTSRG